MSDAGRRDYNGVLGNYLAGRNTDENDTDRAGRIVILPPFGR